MVRQPLRLTLAETSWFGFVLNAILIAAAVNLGTSILLELAGIGWTLVVLVLLPAVALILINLYHAWYERNLLAGSRIIYNRPSPSAKRGLIIMVSSMNAQKQAVDYHAPQLRHVWLIVTPEMFAVAQELESYIRSLGAETDWLRLTNEYDVSMCYQLIREVFEVSAAKQALSWDEIAADMTRGTKPMTAAMVLACADLGVDALEHVPTRFVHGAHTLPLRPIQVTISQSQAGSANAR